MEVFRLSSAKYKDQLSGKGAAIHGQRWNSKGVEMLYTSQSRALAMSEVSVHLGRSSFHEIEFFMLTIFVPDQIRIATLSSDDLAQDWNEFPRIQSTRYLGDGFIHEEKYCVLKVPSVVVKGDYNYLINPKHKSFKRIKIIDSVKFPFDDRLFYK